VVYGTHVRLKKGKSDDEATMAHTTITVLGVIDDLGVFLEVERSGIDLFTVMDAGWLRDVAGSRCSEPIFHAVEFS
jgi:hypothetical protein